MVTSITARDVATHWSLDLPVRVEPITAGTNNRSWLVVTGGDRCLLKSYRNTAHADRVRFEHALLVELNRAGLPFAVPVPVPAISGDTSVGIERDGNVYRLSLFRHIQGRAAEAGSEFDTRVCGEALAVLDRALGELRMSPTISVPNTFGDLASIHSSVPQPVVAMRRALDDRTLSDRVADIAAVTMERWHRQTSGWGTQVIHSDFYPANVRLNEGKVAGVLDFEFAGRGYRAMDFAIGLAAFSTRSWERRCSWPVVKAFASGYLRRAPLRREELEAMPVLLLVRELSSLVHWLGRLEQGLTTRPDLRARARRLLALHGWLDGNQDELIQRLIGIAADSEKAAL